MNKKGLWITLFTVTIILPSTFREGLYAQELAVAQDSKGELISSKPTWQVQVDELDEEIRKLTNQRNLYLSKATRLQNQGDRLQFDAHNLLDARRAWQQAEINREIATRLQKEIDILELQRKILLNKSGIKNYPPSSAYQRSS